MPRPAACVATSAVGLVLAFVSCTKSEILSTTDGGTSGSPGTSGVIVRQDASDEPPPPARAIVETSIGPSPVTREPCPVDKVTPYFTLGTFSPPAPVDDRAAYTNGIASVYCNVTPKDATGANFDVSGSIELSGPDGGKVTVSAYVRGTSVSGVVFTVGKNGKEEYLSNDCTLDIHASGIAAGRFWGDFSCVEGETLLLGGGKDRLCWTRGQVRLENCRQNL